MFGEWESQTGAAGSLWEVLRDRRLGHRLEVVPGVLDGDCAALPGRSSPGTAEAVAAAASGHLAELDA